MYKKSIVVVVASILLWVTTAPAQWWGSGYTCRQKIQFNNTSFHENLTAFPVLIRLDASRIDYGKVDDAGSDLRFIDVDGTTELSYDVQQWDEAGTSLVWVNIPVIDSGSFDDYIWMYYGNNEAVEGADAAGTWNAAYEGVWHLDEGSVDEATYGVYADMTGNGANGLQNGVEKVEGLFCGAQLFENDGGYDYISLPHTVLNGKTDVTSSFWIKTTKKTNFGMISGASSGDGNEYLLWATAAIRFTFSGCDWDIADIADNQWHNIVFVRDDVNNLASLYIDGVPDTLNAQAVTLNMLKTASGGLIVGQDQDEVGGKFDNAQAFLGSMDELRISSVVRSAYWISAQYASMTDNFVVWDSATVEMNPDTLAPDNSLVLVVEYVPSTHNVVLSWNPGSIDSADAYQVGIWYRRNGVPTTPNDPHAVMVDTYTMADSTDTLVGLPAGEYHFMATVRDTQLNVADTTSAARGSVMVPNNAPVADAGDGNALYFGGTDEYASLNDVAPTMAGDDSYSFEFWVKGDIAAQTATYGPGLLCVNTGSGGNVILIRMDKTTGALEFGSDYGPSIGDDLWHHVAYVRTGSTVTIYIDGVLVGTTTTTSTLNVDDQWSLGQEFDNANTTDHFIGQFDEVRIWNTSRSQSEIRATMYCAPEDNEVGLVARYHADASSGDILSDLSGNDYHGILHHMEESDWVISAAWDAPAILEDNALVISAGSDIDGDRLTITEKNAPVNGVVTMDNAAVTLTYTPDADFNGVDSFTYYVTDTVHAVDSLTMIVTVKTVNDPPAFVPGKSDTVNEDSGEKVNPGWASNITAGSAPEVGQVLIFTVTNNHNNLFAVQPSVNETSGDLSYTPAPDAYGEAQVIIYLSDNGGTENGGNDVSVADTFFIVVKVVSDDAPVAGSGNALAFDGMNDYVLTTLDAQPSAITEVTWEAWIHPTQKDYGAWQGILSTDDGGWDRGIWITSGAATFSIGCGAQWVPGVTVETDGWHHIALVFTSTNVLFYYDGTEYFRGVAPSGGATGYDFMIGSSAGGTQCFQGMIDEVRVWDVARSAAEIKDNMHTSLAGIESNLVAYYRCDESSGTDLPDYSGDASTAILMNMDDTDWVESEAWQNRGMDENDTLVMDAGYDMDNDTVAIHIKEAPVNGTFVVDDQAVTITYIPQVGWYGVDTLSYYLTDTFSSDSFEVVVTVKNTNQAPIGSGDHAGLTFDGVNDYMDFDGVAPLMAGDNTFTIEYWARPNIALYPEASAYLFSVNTAGGGNTLMLGSNRAGGAFMVYDGAGSGTEITSSITGNDGVWHHVAYVLNGTTGSLYIDGILQGSHVAHYTLASDDNWSLAMELDTGNPTNEYVGDIDEVRVWNTVRTITEIQNNMQVELAGDEAGLVGYWRLDEGFGSVAEDVSVNHNVGTLMYDTDWVITHRPIVVAYPNINEDDTLTTVSLGSDPDGDVVFVTALSDGDHGTATVDSAALTVTYTPHANWHGTDSLRYALTDPEGLSDTMTFFISVHPVADPITITSGIVDTATEKQHYEYVVTLDDVDGDAVVTLQHYPRWTRVGGDTLSGSVPLGSHGDTSFVIIASNSMYADTLTVALAIKDSNGMVPVELTSFTASAVGMDVRVRWTTATETDNLGFNILRSASQSGPFTLVNDALIPGAGTTVLSQEYTFTDVAVGMGAWFYVLEQVDVTGLRSLSNVVMVELGTSSRDDGMKTSVNAVQPLIRYNLKGVAIPAGTHIQPGIYIQMLNGTAVKVMVTE